MRITDVRTILLTGPSTNDSFLAEARRYRSAAFIEVHTDQKVVGLGETYAGYFCPELVPPVVNFFSPILVGETAEDISRLWQRMYFCGNYWCRTGLGVAVLSGIEGALWDLKGKMEGIPVCELLGGRRHERLACYATGGPCNYPREKLVAKLEFYRSLGFQAFKIGVGSFQANHGWFLPSSPSEAADFEVGKLSYIRSQMGQVQLALDGHMENSPSTTWNLATARAVAKSLEPFDLLFLEEPLPYTVRSDYAELCASTNTPIAGGECLTGSSEWQVFVENDCFDIGQPDASFVGGLTEFMTVAGMLELAGRKIAPHAWGAGGSLMQNLHCGFACSNTAILEIPPAFGPLHTEVLDGSFNLENGLALPPDKPGLGIVLTEQTQRRYPFLPGSGEFNSVPGKILTA